MKPRSFAIFVCTLLLCQGVQAQKPTDKKLEAQRLVGTIKIDGHLTDEAWKTAPLAEGYTEFRPTPFRKEDPANRTEVWMLYNDEGLYLAGFCHEAFKDSIAYEVTDRDGFGFNDFVGFVFDTYKDHINAFEYFVTPLGQQMDARMAPNSNGDSEDFSWNSVWQSKAVIRNDGWTFEIFIPFSAIRFSKQNIQDWGMNITRRRQRSGQQVAWNVVDPNISGFLTQEGYWTGLENIKPPLRLQLYPYFSTYANHYPYNDAGKSNWNGSINGGMDVKYGISQAFTLDMTLIPDFGQVQSDNRVLNLTPFEVKYNENRPFFTEGTELFNKGNLFYSRRVGGTPMYYHDISSKLQLNEKILENPSETKLINATKFSGRMKSGLGIGIFNGITAAQYATVEDDKGNQREIETNPLTNYNIIVLNQSLKHNSSVSLVNTNVLRDGHAYDANVTAGLFDFFDKKNTWNLGGQLNSSRRFNYMPDGSDQKGYSHNIYFGKVSGRFNFNVYQELTDAKYNHSDMGYFTTNNNLNHGLWMGYKWNTPKNWYNRVNINLNAQYSRRYKPGEYQNANFNVNANAQLKNLWWVGALVGYEPAGHDFYEPRAEGRMFKGWASAFADVWFESNSAKKYSVYSEVLYVKRYMMDGHRIQFNMHHRYRFNSKFSLSYALFAEPQVNNVGYAARSGSDIIFGRRDRKTIENVLNFKYNMNNFLGFTTRVRHYWSKVDYKEFFTLLPDAGLAPNPNFHGDVNQNLNLFNVDAVVTWQFAPGSFMNLVWKNAISDFDRQIEKGYFYNLGETMDAEQNNSISLKVIYFIDYATVKKKLAKKV